MSDFLPQHYLTQLVQRTWGGLAPIQPVVSNRFVWGSGWTGADSLEASESPRFPEAPVLPDDPSVSSGLLGANDFPGSSQLSVASLFSEPSSEASSSKTFSLETSSSEALFSEPSPLEASPIEAFSLDPSDEALSVERSQSQPSLVNPEIFPSDQPIVQPIQPQSAGVQPIQPQSPPTRLPDPAVFEPCPSTTPEKADLNDVTAVSTPQTVTGPESVNEVTGSAIEVDHEFSTEISSGADAPVPVSPVHSPLLQRKTLIEPAPLTESNIVSASLPSESILAISEQTTPEQTIPLATEQTVPFRQTSVSQNLEETEVKAPRIAGNSSMLNWENTDTSKKGVKITNNPSPSNTFNTSVPPPAESPGEPNAAPFIETPIDSLSVTSNSAAFPDLPIQPPSVQLPTGQQPPLIFPTSPPHVEPPIPRKSQPTHSQSAGNQELISSAPLPQRSQLQASASQLQDASEQRSLPMVSVVQRLFAPRAQRSTAALPVHQSTDRSQLASQPAKQSEPTQKSSEMTLAVPLPDAVPPKDISSQNLSQTDLNRDPVPLITHAIEPAASPMGSPQGNPSKEMKKTFFQRQKDSSTPFSGDAMEVPARNFAGEFSNHRSVDAFTATPAPPPIKITIGRIDVKVTTPEPVSPPVRQKRQRPNVSLQKYLQQRGEK